MSDGEDRKTAQDAYDIVRSTPECATLPMWDNLANVWKIAFQFVAAHAAVNVESRVAVRSKRVAELEAALRVTCDAVERIAFQIPAPNDATPQLVERVHAARLVLQRK